VRASAPPAVGAIITTAAAAAAGRAVRPKQGPHGRACRLPPPELQFHLGLQLHTTCPRAHRQVARAETRAVVLSFVVVAFLVFCCID
jgi:hypothetical protein